MAIFNTCVATTDEYGREWKNFLRVRAVSLTHAMNKARNIVESALGTDSHAGAAWNCPHQTPTTIDFKGKTGRFYSVGKYPDDLGYQYSRDIVVKDGRWDTMSDLDMSTHEFVVSRVWDKC